MIAVIAGVTGLVGERVLNHVLSDIEFNQVVVVTRRPLGVKHEKLREVIIADFKKLGEVSDQLHGDIYFCCLGTTIKKAGSQEAFRAVDFTAIVEFARVAKANQAKSLVLVSASGASVNSAIFYSRIKGETEGALHALKFPRLVIFRPGLLMGERKEQRRAERFFIKISEAVQPLLPKSIRNRFLTPVEDMSVQMVALGKLNAPGEFIIEAKDIH
jgi:uncharacterized protein YbjT (DUF2867 family)